MGTIYFNTRAKNMFNRVSRTKVSILFGGLIYIKYQPDTDTVDLHFKVTSVFMMFQ